MVVIPPTGISAFEHAIQSVNVKLAAEFVEGNKNPEVIAKALSVKPEDRERAFRKTPERVRDPDVIVGKAFAKAVLDAENTQVIADKLAKVAIDTVLRDRKWLLHCKISTASSYWTIVFFLSLVLESYASCCTHNSTNHCCVTKIPVVA